MTEYVKPKDTAFLQQVLDEIQSLSSEERIRQIVRDELQKWQRQQLVAIRTHMPLSMETK